MPTLNKIAYNIAEMKGRADDFAFIQQTKFQVEYTRSLLFRRDFERTGAIPLVMLQTIKGLDVVPVDAAELADVEVGCDVYRTKIRIPAPINLKGTTAFKYVGTIDYKRNYSYVDVIAVPFLRFNRFSNMIHSYFYRDGYLYLTSNPKKITVSYVLDEPSQLFSILDSNGIPLATEDSEYPASGDMIQRITQTILSTEGQFNTAEDDHKVNVHE